MDEHLKGVYLREVSKQCDFALQAAMHVNGALEVLRSDELRGSGQINKNAIHGEVFRNLHSLLTHASNISRLLWPPRPLRKRGETDEQYKARQASTSARGQKLRELLKIRSNDHPLKSRTLRDHLEHFDERLDNWATTSEHRNILQDYIGPPGGIVGLEASDRMREFDPASTNVTFCGETYNVQALVTAIEELTATAKQKVEEIWHSPPA